MPKNPLESIHKALGAFLVERAGMPMPARYGEVRDEHAMVRRAVGVSDIGSAGKIAVRGGARIEFLQGIVAENLAGLAPGRGAHSLLLASDGGISAEMRVLVFDKEVLLLTPSLARAKVKGVLDRQQGAWDASILDESETLALLTVQGPAAAHALGAALGQPVSSTAPFSSRTVVAEAFGPIVVVDSPRGGEMGFDLLLPKKAAPALFERLVESARKLGGGPAGLDALDAMRVEAGVPAYGSDMDETTLPTEVDAIGRGISMDKPAFLGRDEVARLVAAGTPSRRLVGLLFEGLWPPVRGDRLFHDGAPVGAVTSAAFSPALDRPVALALIATAWSMVGTELLTNDREPATVTRLPFWERSDSTAASSV